MYNKILVPLDGSERAEAILPHVVQIAKASEAQVILLSVLDPSVLNVELVSPMATVTFNRFHDGLAQLWDDTKAYLHDVQTKLWADKLDAEQRMEYGPVVDTIAKVAEEEDVDLVAIASHGRSGLGHLLYGSVASGVLNRLDQPLLVIKSRTIRPSKKDDEAAEPAEAT